MFTMSIILFHLAMAQMRHIRFPAWLGFLSNIRKCQCHNKSNCALRWFTWELANGGMEINSELQSSTLEMTLHTGYKHGRHAPRMVYKRFLGTCFLLQGQVCSSSGQTPPAWTSMWTWKHFGSGIGRSDTYLCSLEQH